MGGIIIGEGSASALSVPMLRGKRVLGVISVYDCADAYAYDESHQLLMETIANQAAVAIENARLFGETERRVAELATLTEIGQALSSTLRVDEVLQLVRQQTRRVMNAEEMIITLYDQERDDVEVALSTDPEDIPAGTRASADDTLSGYVIKHRQPLLLRNNVLEQALEMGMDPVGKIPESALAVPMLCGDRVLGAIVMQHYTVPNTFDTSHQVLLQTLANQAAIAIDNARLYDQAQREIVERVRAEEELLKHQEDLEGLAEERAAELRTSEEQYRTLFDGVPTGLYRSTPGGQLLDANPALVQMLGYSHREVLLAIHLDHIYVDPKERVRWKDQVEREGMVRDFVIRMYQRDGTIIWVTNTARAVRDQQGQVLHYEGSLEDITERRQAAIELQKYQGHLEELVEERTAELAKSEERYRTLFDGVPVGLYRTTADGKILDISPAFVQFLGYPSRQELLAVANAAALYVDPEERDRWQALMDRNGVVRDFAVRVRRYDGTTLWLGDTARAVKDEQGQVLYYEGSVEDISRRKLYEHVIRRQKEYFEALFVNSPVAVITADLNGSVVSWSPAAETLFGYTPDEAIGRCLDDLVANDPRFREEAQALTRQAIQGVRTEVAARRTRKDGSVVDVEIRGLPVIMADEEVGFIVIYHDITERKRFEEQLRRQKEYYEALFVNSPVAVVTADLDACVVSWSPAAEKLFGYTQEEAIGQCLDDLVANDPRFAEEAVHLSNQALNAIRVRATAQRTHRNGSLVDVEILALPVIVGEETVGFIVIYHDITSLQEARRQAEAASDAKSAFLASMSHELRTPLNAILGFTQLMDRAPNLTTEQHENLGIINRSGEHLLALINDVLEMSKIEAGQVELQETTFDLYHLLGGLEEMFVLRTEAKGLKLDFGRADSVPQFVRGDEGKLRQVLVNLLGNAVKFTREGVIKLDVWSREHRAPTMRDPSPLRSVLHFKVQDTGPGMAPEELVVIFDPFVQATSGRDSHEGTGLGLSISRKSVRLMGGDLTVSSEPGSGSAFRFDVSIEVVPLGAAEVQAARVTRHVLGLAPDQPSYRLLIAEDKSASRKLLVRLLEPLGFEVEAVANGQQALEVWRRWEPHLIWMDIRMPIMDGYEATHRIRALQQSRPPAATQGRPTIIIALTASAFDEDRERALLAGCDDFVRKPFRAEEIYEMLAKHLAVRFVYEDADARAAAITAPEADVTAPAAAAREPAEWAADLERATLRADMSQILTLVEEIRGQNAPLAYTLAELAHNFEYKKILGHAQQAGEQR
jgi:PAS domain S-box-containing protein